MSRQACRLQPSCSVPLVIGPQRPSNLPSRLEIFSPRLMTSSIRSAGKSGIQLILLAESLRSDCCKGGLRNDVTSGVIVKQDIATLQRHCQIVREILCSHQALSQKLRSLYELRKSTERKCSLQWLCDRSGIPSKGHLCDMMNGRRKISPRHAIGLAKALKMRGPARILFLLYTQAQFADGAQQIEVWRLIETVKALLDWDDTMEVTLAPEIGPTSDPSWVLSISPDGQRDFSKGFGTFVGLIEEMANAQPKSVTIKVWMS